MFPCITGLQAGKEIGIQPILSAEEMVKPQDGHLAVMAYAARFINRPVIKQSAASYMEILFNTVDITPGSKVKLKGSNSNIVLADGRIISLLSTAFPMWLIMKCHYHHPMQSLST